MISTSPKKKEQKKKKTCTWHYALMNGGGLSFFFFFLIQWMRQCSRPLKRILIDMQLNSDSPLTLWEIHFSRRKVKMWDLNWMISSQREVPWKLWSLCPPPSSSYLCLILSHRPWQLSGSLPNLTSQCRTDLAARPHQLLSKVQSH